MAVEFGKASAEDKSLDSGFESLSHDEGIGGCSETYSDSTSSNLSVKVEPKLAGDECYVPRHGLNSSYDSLKHSSTVSDRGFVSNTSDPSSASSSLSETSLPQSEDHPSSSSEITRLTFEQYFNKLVSNKPNPYTWTKGDFSYKLSKSEVDRAGKALWDANEEDEDGDFETMCAARDHDEPAVAFAVFLAESAQVLNTKNLDRQTVLHAAAELLSAQAVRLFMAKGADGAVTDLWGNTPLHIAARFGRAEVVTELTTKLRKDELGHPRYKVPYRSLPQDNKDQMNNDGKAPVHLAAQGGHAETLAALSRAKVDLDQRRLGDGNTALHIAVDNNDYMSMKTLLECGADLEVKNHRGETPQQLAYLCGKTDMVDLCATFGASPNQLLFAETDAVDFLPEDMDVSDDDLASQVSQMSV